LTFDFCGVALHYALLRRLGRFQESRYFVNTTPQKSLLPLFLLIGVLSAPAFGLHRYVPPRNPHRATTRRTHFRRLAWNPMFRPSRESLLRQNEEVDRLDLPRIQDDDELEQLKASEDLVPIVPGTMLRFDPRLDPDRRYCRPWTRDFVNDLSEAYYKEFHQQIQVNSAVRTVKVQKKLRRHNRNAAPAEGDLASSHLAGITVDIQRRGMTRQQVQWMEQYLLPLRDLGLIEPEEERRQWVFHIMVSDRYTDWRESKILAGEQPEQTDETPEIKEISNQEQ
jgi:uncharacterized protein DUF5715